MNNRVVIIATDYPTHYDKHFRNRLENLMLRAVRHKDRFSQIDLPDLQAVVNNNISRLQLKIEGKYTGLLDLMNYVLENRSFPKINPQNAHNYLTHAEMITLNGIYLYQFLLRNGFDTHVIQNYSLADLKKVLDPKPLAVCISSNFIYLDEIGDIASEIKSIDPDIPIIAGGLLVKKVFNEGYGVFPQTMKWLQTFHGKVDQFVIEFRGEETLVRSLQALQKKKDISQIPNLATFNKNKELVFTRREIEVLNMNDSCVDWNAIPDQYLRKTVPVTTSRGCSYRCKFCTCWKLCPQVHYKSLTALKNELRQIQEKNFVKHVRFTDDNFTANKNRLKKVLQMILDEGFTFTWSTYARAGSLTPEMVPMMAEAGCEFVNMGIESGSQTILDNMDKRLEREQIIDAIKRLNANEIYGEGGFILGFPGETIDTFEDTLDLVNSSRLPFFQPNLFYFSKEMGVADDQDKYGITGLALTWKHNTIDSAQASELMVKMVDEVKYGYHEPQVSVWETFRLLRGEGYSSKSIYKLLGYKSDLRKSFKNSEGHPPFSNDIETTLDQFKELVIHGKE
ncbi:MAG: radical SAM protein [Desulfobacteraceae bacterium]|nr:radical SAM protein [Desulfobacteraceae bacterium]